MHLHMVVGEASVGAADDYTDLPNWLRHRNRIHQCMRCPECLDVPWRTGYIDFDPEPIYVREMLESRCKQLYFLLPASSSPRDGNHSVMHDAAE